MRILPLFFVVLFSLMSLSCQRNNVYREFHEFNNYTWGRFDKVKFEISIDEEGFTGDIILSVRYLDQFPYEILPVNVVLTTPSGEERIIEREIKIKDENNTFRGSVAGSYWDIEEPLWKGFYFNKKGTYVIELENIHPRPGIPALVDLGLTIRKV
jgi:gliding motility-associated lipoprotein GldH